MSVGIDSLPFFTIIQWSPTTLWSFNMSLISIPDNSRQRMTQREECKVLWTKTCTSQSTKQLVLNKFTAWAFRLHSARKEPSCSLLELFRVVPIAWKPVCIAKEDNLCRGALSLADLITRNLGYVWRVTKLSYSESVSFSLLPFLTLFKGILWAKLGFKCFITLSSHPPPGPTRGCICERISSSQGSKCSILR